MAGVEREVAAHSGIPDYLIRHATLRQLQVFEATVRLGSFTRAAEALFLTQPTVSVQMKKLTDVIGLTLLEQVGRRTRPTEAGQALYVACRDMFRTLANLEIKISDLKGLRCGRLRLGVITTAKYFAPEVLGEFCRQYPGIDISLKVTNRDRIIERIHAGEDDLYILGSPPTDELELELETQAFAPNPLVVVAGRNHPLVGERRLSLARIADEHLILREPGSGTRDAVIKLFASKGLKPRVRLELGSNEAIKHAVVGELGIAILSLHTLTLEGVLGPVAVLDVEGFPILRHLYLVHHRSRELSLVAKAFLSFALRDGPRVRVLMNQLLQQAGFASER